MQCNAWHVFDNNAHVYTEICATQVTEVFDNNVLLSADKGFNISTTHLYAENDTCGKNRTVKLELLASVLTELG